MSFIALLLYFFCTFIRPQDWVAGFFEMPVINILANTTLGLVILEKLATRKFEIVKVPQNWLLLGFYFSILFSHIPHTYFEGLQLSFWAFLPIFILFYIILNAINTELKLKISLWFIVLMVLILVPQGVYQLQHGYGWGGQEITFDPDRKEYRINWIGIFNDPNDLALIFVVAFGIVISFVFGKSNFLAKVVNVFFSIVLFYGIFLTNSRGGLLALLATIYFFFVRITRKFTVGGIIGGVATAAIFAVGPSRIGIINTSEDSANSRIELWYEGVQMFKSNPIFGVGHGMFMDQVAQTAHNSFVLVFSELGFVGFFFWVGLIYASFKCLSYVQDNDERLKTYSIGLQSSLVGFCAAAFFLSRAYMILPYLLFAFSGAMAGIVQQKRQDQGVQFTKKDARNVFFICVGIFIAVMILIKVGI
jgi:putative inorganic carbon (HCO3(-)) transporter